MNETLYYAITYYDHGLSIIPARYKSKLPLIRWKRYQYTRASPSEIYRWFSRAGVNIAIICGEVSGNLIVFDFDGENIHEYFMQKLSMKGLDKFFRDTWVVRTYKGYHYYFRLWEKMRTIRTFLEIGGEHVELRGEASYVIAPPSIHPTGHKYYFIRNNPLLGGEIRYLTQEEYLEIKKAIFEEFPG